MHGQELRRAQCGKQTGEEERGFADAGGAREEHKWVALHESEQFRNLTAAPEKECGIGFCVGGQAGPGEGRG
jgi:hypothetical protein